MPKRCDGVANSSGWSYVYDFLIYVVFTILLPVALVTLQLNKAYSNIDVSTQSLIVLFAVPYALGAAASTRKLRLIVATLVLCVIAVILCSNIFILPDAWLKVSAAIVTTTGIFIHFSIAYVRFMTNKNRQSYT